MWPTIFPLDVTKAQTDFVLFRIIEHNSRSVFFSIQSKNFFSTLSAPLLPSRMRQKILFLPHHNPSSTCVYHDYAFHKSFIASLHNVWASYCVYIMHAASYDTFMGTRISFYDCAAHMWSFCNFYQSFAIIKKTHCVWLWVFKRRNLLQSMLKEAIHE
jgi:hypothetical protein